MRNQFPTQADLLQAQLMRNQFPARNVLTNSSAKKRSKTVEKALNILAEAEHPSKLGFKDPIVCTDPIVEEANFMIRSLLHQLLTPRTEEILQLEVGESKYYSLPKGSCVVWRHKNGYYYASAGRRREWTVSTTKEALEQARDILIKQKQKVERLKAAAQKQNTAPEQKAKLLKAAAQLENDAQKQTTETWQDNDNALNELDKDATDTKVPEVTGDAMVSKISKAVDKALHARGHDTNDREKKKQVFLDTVKAISQNPEEQKELIEEYDSAQKNQAIPIAASQLPGSVSLTVPSKKEKTGAKRKASIGLIAQVSSANQSKPADAASDILDNIFKGNKK
jgi:hypothetical protein